MLGKGAGVKFNIVEEFPAVGLMWRRKAAFMTDYCPPEEEGSGATPHISSPWSAVHILWC